MKDITRRLLVRNGFTVGACVVLMVLTPYAPSSRYAPARIIVALGSLIALVAASGILWRHTRHWLAAILIVFATVALGSAVILISTVIGKAIRDYQYRISRLTMTKGCNAAKAMRAEIEVYEISQRIENAKRTPGDSASQLRELQAEYEAAKVRLAFWERDLRTRGHRSTVPILNDANQVPVDTARQLADPQH